MISNAASSSLASYIRLVPDRISIKISHIDRYFAKDSREKYFPVLNNKPIYLIYMKSHREQLYY